MMRSPLLLGLYVLSHTEAIARKDDDVAGDHTNDTTIGHGTVRKELQKTQGALELEVDAIAQINQHVVRRSEIPLSSAAIDPQGNVRKEQQQQQHASGKDITDVKSEFLVEINSARKNIDVAISTQALKNKTMVESATGQALQSDLGRLPTHPKELPSSSENVARTSATVNAPSVSQLNALQVTLTHLRSRLGKSIMELRRASLSRSGDMQVLTIIPLIIIAVGLGLLARVAIRRLIERRSAASAPFQQRPQLPPPSQLQGEMGPSGSRPSPSPMMSRRRSAGGTSRLSADAPESPKNGRDRSHSPSARNPLGARSRDLLSRRMSVQ